MKKRFTLRMLSVLMLMMTLTVISMGNFKVSADNELHPVATCTTHSKDDHWRCTGELMNHPIYGKVYPGNSFTYTHTTFEDYYAEPGEFVGTPTVGSWWYWDNTNKLRPCDGHVDPLDVIHAAIDGNKCMQLIKEKDGDYKFVAREYTAVAAAIDALGFEIYNVDNGGKTFSADGFNYIIEDISKNHTFDGSDECEYCGFNPYANHQHSWEYSKVGEDTFKASCTEDYHKGSKDLTITITVENTTYTGSPIAATFIGASEWEAAGLLLPMFTYIGRDGTDYPLTSTAPTNLGCYTAQSLADNKTVTFDFEIKKPVPTYTVPTGLIAKEGQTLAEITLPEGFTWADSTLSVGKAGENKFNVTYTPADTEQYSIVENIEVTVTVEANAPQGGGEKVEGNKMPAGAVVAIVLACLVVVLGGAYAAGYFFLYRKGLLAGKKIEIIYSFLKK